MQNDHPLIIASKAGDVSEVTSLLTEEPDAVDVRGWMDITPLIAATWEGDSPDVVRLLLDAGADPLAVRTNGDGALHWAASGEVATLLATAAGKPGLAARYLFDHTPLHVAADKGRADVVAAFLAEGADPAALDRYGNTPLDLADNPAVALLLVESGAPLRTARPSTPLHDACRRAAGDPSWSPVVSLLLERGADSALRDEFGALPGDLLGDHPLRDGLVSAELTAEGAHGQLAIRPDGTEAVTTMYSGAVLVRWTLSPSTTPVEVLRSGDRRRVWGPADAGLAFSDRESVWLRDWVDLDSVRTLPADALPEDLHPHPVVSPDGHLTLLPSSEELHVFDLVKDVVTTRLTGFGDWSVLPRFSPDGATVAVANSMQGTWWLTVLDVADGTLSLRYEHTADLPNASVPEIVSDVAFTPNGLRFATWVRPDHHGAGESGYRGMAVATRTDTGATVWHRRVDDDTVGVPGEVTSARLSFTADGAWLAVGLDTGVLWLDAETGTPAAHDPSPGRVNALASHPDTGVLATTAQGLRQVTPPS
ncbi:ankyrin repeat domain-containing protein [Actinophytocola oryzae]|uniref:Ankyrin repeat protein n=1 Tax=Actinophytocola oryzae TaxID=502181 RepID=A0A4R7W3R6_9PSEU|nr:ankyrin repeat domain-containing protein [Actinophytocola oryzae]TDV57303.1 ankyrin repeat protein [Actinophytocola oryzae]